MSKLMPELEPELDQVIDDAFEAATAEGADDEDDLVEGELLVEEVSIDGMCGVY